MRREPIAVATNLNQIQFFQKRRPHSGSMGEEFLGRSVSKPSTYHGT